MTSRFQLPPILKATETLWLAIERAVELFPARKHRNGVGSRLNDLAFEVCSLANRAWHDRRQQRYLVDKLRWKLDQLKLCLTMAKRLQAFNGKSTFFQLALQAEQLGAQVGGWFKSLSPNAQEAAHVRARTLHGTPADFRLIQARAGSYMGHLQHANAWRLRQALHRRFPWLEAATRPRRFALGQEGRHVTIGSCA